MECSLIGLEFLNSRGPRHENSDADQFYFASILAGAQHHWLSMKLGKSEHLLWAQDKGPQSLNLTPIHFSPVLVWLLGRQENRNYGTRFAPWSTAACCRGGLWKHMRTPAGVPHNCLADTYQGNRDSFWGERIYLAGQRDFNLHSWRSNTPSSLSGTVRSPQNLQPGILPPALLGDLEKYYWPATDH